MREDQGRSQRRPRGKKKKKLQPLFGAPSALSAAGPSHAARVCTYLHHLPLVPTLLPDSCARVRGHVCVSACACERGVRVNRKAASELRTCVRYTRSILYYTINRALFYNQVTTSTTLFSFPSFSASYVAREETLPPEGRERFRGKLDVS